MDRKIVYAGQIPLSAQVLQAERNHMIGLGYLAETVFGTPTLVDGLQCIPSVPASLSVQMLRGTIFQLMNVDGGPFGSLLADVSHNVVKEGISQDTQTFTLVAPITTGHAVNYLIQGILEEVDEDPLVLPYVNSANPAQPWTGPNNSGISQPTSRICRARLSAKAGVSATSGTQTTPAPDSGWVGLYAVTVAQGATQITSAEIHQLETAPFLFKKLPELPRWVQSGEFLWGNDAGTKNAIVAKLNPVPTQYKAGMHVFIKKMATANDGNVTVNLMGPEGVLLGAVALLDATGAQIAPGNLTGSFVIHAVYDGTAFRWVNGSVTNTSISSITATSGEGVTVGGSAPYPVSLNFPGLDPATPTALDLFAFYDHEGGHHRTIDYAALFALLTAGTAPGLVNMQVFTESATYTKTAGAKKAIVICTAGGGGGGSGWTNSWDTGAGAGAGATALAFVDLAGVSTAAVTVGLGGTPNIGGSRGNDGGLSQFGSFAKALGGVGGINLAGNGPGGDGGTATIGQVLMGGNAGCGVIGNRTGTAGGNGGPSFWGGGGKGADKDNGPGTGGPGLAPGAGGGGGDSNPGGKGGDGIVVVLEFA